MRKMQSISFIKRLDVATRSFTRKDGFKAVIKVCLPFTFIVRYVVANDVSMSL